MVYCNINKNSFLSNIVLNEVFVSCIFVIVSLAGCYSFTGGTVPEHLKDIYIATVNDNSGYGNPAYRSTLTENLIEKFRNDSPFRLVERGGDARLEVSITSISDQTMTVSPGELETERKINVTCQAVYYDRVKNKEIWKKTFSNGQVYDLANAQAARDEAVNLALEQISDDILLAVVSGW